MLAPEAPFEVFMDAQNPELEIMSAWLEGKTMYMGKIPVFFSRQHGSLWSSEVMVGACSDPVMEWQLTVELGSGARSKEGDKTVTFSLYTSQK